MIFVYVLRGEAGKKYVGITNDLQRRLKELRSKRSKGGQLIGDFQVIHTETCTDSKLREKGKNFSNPAKGGNG